MDTTSGFGLKVSKEKIRGNREELAFNCLRHLCFSEEMKFTTTREVVFQKLKIRSTAINATGFM